MPEVWKAQVVHKHKNGLPRDSFVNTFWFEADNAIGQIEAEAVAERVRDFYVADLPVAAIEVCDLFGKQVALTGHEVRMYPIDVTTGQDIRGMGYPPVWIETFDHLTRTANPPDGMPSEVAVCLSFKNTTAGAVPPARRRGRVYIGPLGSGEGATDATTGRRHVGGSIPAVLLEAADRLKDQAQAGGQPWVVYSRPYEGRDEVLRPGRPSLPPIAARPGATYPIDTAWVDDAFDTQRRRGERAVARTTQAL